MQVATRQANTASPSSGDIAVEGAVLGGLTLVDIHALAIGILGCLTIRDQGLEGLGESLAEGREQYYAYLIGKLHPNPFVQMAKDLFTAFCKQLPWMIGGALANLGLHASGLKTRLWKPIY